MIHFINGGQGIHDLEKSRILIKRVKLVIHETKSKK